MNAHSATSARECPICRGACDPSRASSRPVHRQSFASFSSGGLLAGYDVVLCGHCGAAYADDLPPQAAFDQYYAEMSKYEPTDQGGAIDPVFLRAADLLAPHLTAGTRIADIGCATGSFLAELKNRGQRCVVGFDPSLNCCRAARTLYDVEVRQATISQLSEVTDRFDMLLSTGVLEHLRDVETSLRAMISLLGPDGRMFLAVPDASRYDRWFGAPFQHFSMEHVNFFSPTSLGNLMGRFGFVPRFIERETHALGPASTEPILMALFERPGAAGPGPTFTFDPETGPALERYVAASRRTDTRIGRIIAPLAERQTPLLVWGAGTHTLRLLETSPLRQANIVGFVDRNQNYRGKKLYGKPVLAPDQLEGIDATILISSQTAEAEIKTFVKRELRWPTDPICLYERTAADDHDEE